MVEPYIIRTGESLKWYRDEPADYTAALGYSLKYELFNADQLIEITEDTLDGGRYLVEVSAATTADWVPGAYDWACYATKSGEKWFVAEGTVEIVEGGTARDARSHARKMLDAIEATLQGKATRDQQSLSIAGRSISRYTPDELEQWRDKYRREVRLEERRKQIADGRSPNRAKARFS